MYQIKVNIYKEILNHKYFEENILSYKICICAYHHVKFASE